MASDVEIVVGAKDQASKILEGIADETRQMTKSVQQMATKSVAATNRIEVGFDKLKAAAGPLLAAFAAFKGATAAFSFAGDSVAAFNTQEEAVRKLTKAIELNGDVMSSGKGVQAFESSLKNLSKSGGVVTDELIAQASAVGITEEQLQSVSGAAGGTWEAEEAIRNLTNAAEQNASAMSSIGGHEAFASKLQNLTNIGDEVTLGLMAQASALGVADDQLQNVTRAALGMSEATGASLEDSLRKVNETMNGNAEAFAEFLPQLRNMATEEEKLAAIQKIASDGLKQKQDATNTAAGAAERAANSWGDFKEQIGAILAPVQQLVQTGLAVAAKVLQDVLSPALSAAGGFAGMFEGAVQKMTKGIVAGITMIEVVVTNIPKIWQMAVAGAELQIIRLVETVKHAFSVKIPAYVKWLSENIINLGRDALVGYVTMFQNMATKVGNILSTLWDFVTSGGAGGFENLFSDLAADAAGSLLEGFEAKTESLPDIVARQITDRESELTSKIGKLGGDLSGEFQDKFSRRMKGFDKDSGIADALDVAKLEMTKKAEEVAEAATATTKATTPGNLTASESRLQTRGSAEQGIDKVAKYTEETAKETKALNGLMKGLGNAINSLADKGKDGLQVEVVG